MKRKFFNGKKFTLLFLLLVLIVVAPFAKAQNFYNFTIYASAYTQWMAILFGFLASITTFRYALQFKGSTIGKIFGLFGFGMLLVLLGGFSDTFLLIPHSAQTILHDLMFASGYAFMLLGASYIKQLSS